MTAESVWDDPELAAGEYVKFENPGDTISGVITLIGKKRWDDGKVAPQLDIIDEAGESRTITAGQARLQYELREQRPEVGDRIAITFTSVEKRAGGKTLKHFDVTVTRGAVGAGWKSETPSATTTGDTYEGASTALAARLASEGKSPEAAAAIIGLDAGVRESLGYPA